MKKMFTLLVLALFTLTVTTFVLDNSQAIAQVVNSFSAKKDLENIKKLIAGDEPIIWVFTGDSITHGCHHLHGWKNYIQVCEERIRWELGQKRFRDVFINTAISGNTTQHLVKDFNHRVTKWNPTIVSIKIGMNDGRRRNIKLDVYKNNLEKLVNDIRATGAIAILQTTNTSQNANDVKNLDPYMDVTRQIAKEMDVILVDNYAFWKKNDKESQKNWFNDSIHPNGKGQIEIARCFLETIGITGKSAALNEKGK